MKALMASADEWLDALGEMAGDEAEAQRLKLEAFAVPSTEAHGKWA